MDLQAYFSDIRTIIAEELDVATESVVAAVAWLTDPVLLEALVKAARRGCRVQLALLDDAINLEVERRLAEIRVLRASETYQTLAAQLDWAAYFATVRQRLEQECAALRQKIAESGNGG